MFNELRNVEGGCGALILDNNRDILSTLLGKSVEMYAPRANGRNLVDGREVYFQNVLT